MNIFSTVDEVKVGGVTTSAQSDGGDDWLMKQWIQLDRTNLCESQGVAI